MSKNINITGELIRIPKKIVVDGKNYPRTQHNINVVTEYWKTDDEKVLDRLSLAVLSFD